MKTIKNILSRFTSRKFLLTVGGVVAVTQFPEMGNQIVALIAAYNGAEGAADAVGRYANIKGEKMKEAVMGADTWGQDDVDTTQVEPGASDIPMDLQ